jgi:hypothetical protein
MLPYIRGAHLTLRAKMGETEKAGDGEIWKQ